MSNFRKIKQHIKFSLHNLGAENAHYDFESICRHFSRKRLGLNILPATGPVSAGGDQGRDFETYTIIPEVVPYLEKNKKIILTKAAFACTTQLKSVPSKIKDDIKKATSSSDKVDIVYYFSLKDVPISKRHDLQEWAIKTYFIKLEIIDGEALSEELATNDLFWIAEEYLHIPADLFPGVDDIDYLKLKERWGSKKAARPNYADFNEVRALARRSLFDDALKQDLPFWLKKLIQFSEISLASSEFKRKALYEVVALRIRGMKSLRGWEKYVYSYFDADKGFSHQIEAQEACVVLTYSIGALFRGAADFPEEDLKKWKSLINDYVEDELQRDYPKTIQATLFELKGSLSLIDHDIERTLSWWSKIVPIIEETPLFPLERFSDVLTAIIPIVKNNPKFNELTAKVDELVASRIGNFAVADKCRDRALEYKKNGDLLEALRELHRAKVNWFANETLYGSLLSMMLISNIYFELGLLYAAKYYAMTVIFIASRSDNDKVKSFITKGFIELFETEYGNGEWAHFIEHAGFALRSLGIFSKDLNDPVSEKEYLKILFYSSTVYAVTHIFDKGRVFEYVKKRIDSWGIQELKNDLIPIAEKSWAKVSSDELIEKIKSEFKGPLFNDIGLQRESQWQACGIKWHFYWENSLHNNAKAEQLISLIQIILAEIADKDFYLLSTNAEVRISFGDRFHVEQSPSNYLSAWSVVFPSGPPGGKLEIQDYHINTLGIATVIIAELSLLPMQRIEEEIKVLFEQGLTSKVMSGNSYEVVFVDLTPKDLYEEVLSLKQIDYLKSIKMNSQPHMFLSWRDGLLDIYNHKVELKKIERRYKRSIIPIKQTLKQLNKQTEFLEIVKKLRNENWKDWHILMSLAQIAVNYRVNKLGFSDFKKMNDLFFTEMDKEESKESPSIPLSIFSEKAIRYSLFLSLISTLKILGLEVKAKTPNTNAINNFLSKRLNYWENDIKHDKIFNV